MRNIYEIIEMKTALLILSDDDKEWMEYFKALCFYDMTALRESPLEFIPDNSDIE
jgi:hypothetical protein